ncbi:MAG: ABC transporter ATP-binding protein [Verrucomicrobiota bacterium]|jgi:oligopeptide transport system ATP-binding protein|nr:dipeptide/oligopeptide/nickel ABC transporter ATP-binding protein [Verrucomicrobiales bacterium]MEE2941772.1 ABC transporter ATP-binding protein [Verrucomicrobiota bacterium]
MSLLKVDNLATYFDTRQGTVRAVDGVSLGLEKGETLGIVGESGSGKSVTCYSLLRLIPEPPGRIVSGTAIFDGENLLQMPKNELNRIRARKISMIFQDPMTSLNPYMRVGVQLIEPLLIHQICDKRQARERALDMMNAVGIPDPETRYSLYPHEFSGGMRQRIMIAMALITKPELLIADEPTTALDVTVQAQILELIRKMQEELGMAVILITHDLGVVSGFCDRVSVMYCGKVVESGTADDIFYRAHHAYTRGLKKSIPSIQEKGKELFTIPGVPAQPIGQRQPCAFTPRSDLQFTEEEARMPAEFVEVKPGHWVEVHPASVENYKEYLK